MKSIFNLIGKNLLKVVGSSALLLALSVMALAESQTKTFEVGLGTGQERSHFRTFNIPCGLAVKAEVKYSRLGDPNTKSQIFDVPVVVELHKPATSGDADGPLAQEKSVTATRTEQSVSLLGAESNVGCSNAWRVRVRHANAGNAPLAITGTITVSYNDSAQSISIQGGLISLNKGNSVTKTFGGSGGLNQGKITITANWNHAVGPVPGPLPVRLKFELINPAGTVVASQTAYSSNEIRSDKNPKLKLTYTVPDCVNGQWKIRITNDTNDDTMNIDPKASFKPDCPN